MTEVREIDFGARTVTTKDERRLPIVDLFDRSGLRTFDSDAAVMCLAGEPGKWISLKLAPFEKRGLQ
ncbi:MAG: hypothetical protein JOZ27_07995 [Caulobacteraceae bacterium]|nr:hypothetical protein [Caulobacteraceae bacterium]